MVLSMASIAMAANTAIDPDDDKNTGANIWTDIVTSAKNPESKTGKTIPYGKTVYVALVDGENAQFTKADEVDGLKISAKWDKNGEYIASTEIGKKEGKYWIIIKTTGTSMDENDVEGTLTLSGKVYTTTSGDKKVKLDPKVEKDIIITLAYDEYTGYEVNGGSVAALTSVIPEDRKAHV